jgi:hypothetical protein
MNTVVNYQDQKNDITHLRELAQLAVKSGNYPNLNEMSMLNIMLSARDLGVSPMKALNGGFYVVNGKISMSTSLMADRIRKEGHSIKIMEFTREKCVIMGIRCDNKDSVKLEFTWEDATLAGLTGGAMWKKYPKTMLYNRAMSMLARMLYSDVVGACYSEDEGQEIRNGRHFSGAAERIDPSPVVQETICVEETEAIEEDLGSLCEQLAAAVEIPEQEEYFVAYLEFCKSKISKPMTQVVEGWLSNPEPFIKHYRGWIAKKKVQQIESDSQEAEVA